MAETVTYGTSVNKRVERVRKHAKLLRSYDRTAYTDGCDAVIIRALYETAYGVVSASVIFVNSQLHSATVQQGFFPAVGGPANGSAYTQQSISGHNLTFEECVVFLRLSDVEPSETVWSRQETTLAPRHFFPPTIPVVEDVQPTSEE